MKIKRLSNYFRFSTKKNFFQCRKCSKQTNFYNIFVLRKFKFHNFTIRYLGYMSDWPSCCVLIFILAQCGMHPKLLYSCTHSFIIEIPLSSAFILKDDAGCKIDMASNISYCWYLYIRDAEVKSWRTTLLHLLKKVKNLLPKNVIPDKCLSCYRTTMFDVIDFVE